MVFKIILIFWIPAFETVSQFPFRHSVQAKRDTESSIFSKFWMPTFVGMTVFMALFIITTQPLRRNDKRI
jgi:hypothetical protein